MYSWSDPERVDMQDILDTVALYYLSGSFATSVVIYNQVLEFNSRKIEQSAKGLVIASYYRPMSAISFPWEPMKIYGY